jgi:LuxR family transcriptional regulator, maltose regulon positive regulatory protein
MVMETVVQRPNGENTDIPVYGFVAERQALKDALTGISRHRITIISAPPGYGKTTAVAHFVRETSIPAAWHSIQERERDLAALHLHSLQALEFIAPGISIAAASISSPDECAQYITNYLRDSASQRSIYVIDDLHLISASPQAERWLRTLVRHLPSTCHLVLISRTLPDLPIAELIAKGDVLAIGQEQLKFSTEDAWAFAEQVGANLSDEALRERIHQLEGWPVGVAITVRPLPSDFQVGFLRGKDGPEALFNTLANQLLNSLPPVLSDFLLTSSVVSQVTPEICHNVLNLPHSTGIMSDVVRRNLFASQISGGLMLHRLFRNFLQQRLEASDPERYVQLHNQAGDWYRDQNQDDEAFQHYITARRMSEALSIVGRTHRAYFQQGNVEMLLRWRSLLGDHALELPQFIYTCAMILTDRYLYDDALRELELAEAGFEAHSDRVWVCEVKLQRAMIHIWQGNHRVARAQALPISQDHTLPDIIVSRARHMLALVDLTTGKIKQAIDHLEAILPIFERTNDTFYVSGVLQDLALAYTSAGQLDGASHCLQRLVAIRRTLGQPNALALALNNLGDHYHQIGDYELALRTLEEGLEVISETNNQRAESYLRWTMGDLQRDLGNDDAAALLYNSAYESSIAEPSLQQSVRLSMATLYRWSGDYQRALRFARRVVEDFPVGEEPQPSAVLLARAAYSALSAMLDYTPDVLDELDELLHGLSDRSAASEFVQIAILAASVAISTGDERRALHYLRDCAASCDRGIGRNIVAVEIVNTPHLRAFVEQNPQLRSLQTAVQRLLAARQMFSSSSWRDATETPDTTYSLRVLVLGDELIERDGRQVSTSEWRSSRAKEFFLYLLFEGPSKREQISLMFWPDSSPERVRSNFHTTLYRARRALGENVILYDDDIYRINPDVNIWCDALVFSRYVRQAQMLSHYDVRADDLYRKAIEYYKGDFLPSLDAEWVIPHRETRFEMYISALIGAGHCAHTRRDYGEAVSLFKRALKVDPYREEAYRALFTSYAARGELSRVVKQYDDMKAFFKSELGIPPSPETHMHVKQLTQHIS